MVSGADELDREIQGGVPNGLSVHMDKCMGLHGREWGWMVQLNAKVSGWLLI